MAFYFSSATISDSALHVELMSVQTMDLNMLGPAVDSYFENLEFFSTFFVETHCTMHVLAARCH